MGPGEAHASPSVSDPHAEFGAFYELHARSAARYAAAILGPTRREEVGDVTQEAWARAWRTWSGADPCRRAAWFFRIVRNCALDRHRAGRSRPDECELDAEHGAMAVQVDFEVALVWDEALRLVSTLPPGLRETLWLRAVEDMTYQEIAAALDVPIGTVMSRLSAARRRLARRAGRLA